MFFCICGCVRYCSFISLNVVRSFWKSLVSFSEHIKTDSLSSASLGFWIFFYYIIYLGWVVSFDFEVYSLSFCVNRLECPSKAHSLS